MTEEEIYEQITVEDDERPILGKYGAVEGYKRDFSPEKLAAFLAKHITK